MSSLCPIWKLHVPFLLVLISSSSVLAQEDSSRHVSVRGVVSVDRVHPGSIVQAAAVAVVESGYHVNAHKPTLDYLIPTELKLGQAKGLTFGEVSYPNSTRLKFGFADEALDVYEKTIVMKFTVNVAPDFAAETIPIPAQLTVQACNDHVCLAPATIDLKIPITVALGNQSSNSLNSEIFENTATPSGSLGENDIERLLRVKGSLLAFIIIFLGGLSLNLTPCVYPMIPITIGFFSGQSAGKSSRVLFLAAAYVLGIAITYSSLGVAAALSGKLFGALLQNPFVILLLAAVMVALALSMFGLFELRPPAFLMRKVSGKSEPGVLGSLSMGLVVGIVAAPCIGPFTLSLLTYVGKIGNPWVGFWMFFTLSLGLGLPYVFLAAFSGALQNLPRSGVWMVWVKKVFGFVLIGMALYFAQPLIPEKVALVVALTLALGAGIYLGWLERSQTPGRAFYWVKKVVGAAAIAIAIFLAIPQAPARSISWQPYTPESLARAQQDGKYALLDFYADWCVPCRELDRSTFADESVIEATRSIATFKVNLTDLKSPESEMLRRKYNILGVPTVILVDPQGRERESARVVGFIPPKDFVDRLKR